MAWKQVYKDRDTIIHNFKEDKTLVGDYIGKEENKGQRGNSTIHHLYANGQEVTFWGSTVLDGKLKSVEEHYGFNTKVKITYKGTVKPKNSGNPYHDWDVEVWTEGAVDKNGNEIDLKQMSV